MKRLPVKQKLHFSFQETADTALAHLKRIAQEKKINTYCNHIQNESESNYSTPFASLALPFDTSLKEKVKHLVEEKLALKPTLLVVIGIGGSALGAKAVHQAIRGRFYHAGHPRLRVYFLQTIDSNRVATLMQVLEQELEQGNNVLINVITKSGTTTETVVNFEVVLAVLKKYRSDYQKLVVVTTDKNSPLWVRAQSENFALLEIPKLVGGRYSVFSAVGLFPLAIAGLDIDQLLAGARAGVSVGLSKDVEQNPALLSALLLYVHYNQSITIHDMFIFSVDLEAVGKWYRQLMGESIGKELNNQGERVLAGITPTVSLGTIDLHSVAQLYLGGPRDKFTTFVTVENGHKKITIPETAPSYLRNKTLSDLMHAFVEGTQRAYKKNNRPFCTITLPEKNEFFLGKFLQIKMLEIMYLGYLLDVDPFDQPNVELYKKEVKAIVDPENRC
jgi:glucose-6-phosphate isomerase